MTSLLSLLITRVRPPVSDQIGDVVEFPSANLAHASVRSEMDIEMRFQVCLSEKSLPAYLTDLGSFLTVNAASVIIELRDSIEDQFAPFAFEGSYDRTRTYSWNWFISRSCRNLSIGIVEPDAVGPQVVDEQFFVRIAIFAQGTKVFRLVRICVHSLFQFKREFRALDIIDCVEVNR